MDVWGARVASWGFQELGALSLTNRDSESLRLTVDSVFARVQLFESCWPISLVARASSLYNPAAFPPLRLPIRQAVAST